MVQLDEGRPAVLKDGRRITIRQYRPADKEQLVSMYAQLSEDSLRWGMPPYNRERIDRFTADPEHKIIVVAQDKDRIVGHMQIGIATNARFRGIGELFIYLHQDFQNVGLGTAMMREGLGQARARKLHRVELSVVAENQRGIRSYEKVGFQREGVKRENYLGEDGKYYDEILMGILL